MVSLRAWRACCCGSMSSQGCSRQPTNSSTYPSASLPTCLIILFSFQTYLFICLSLCQTAYLPSQ